MENRLDERLSAAAALALEAIEGEASPCAADIGCDHGYLTAYLLGRRADLMMIAGDVSAPSLDKARRLFSARGLTERVHTAVADGLGAIDRPVHAVIMAGMGARTILKIVGEGRERIGGAALIVQANVDIPLLRAGLAQLGYAVIKENYVLAAGRRYVTMLARPGGVRPLTEREAYLGTALGGAADEAARGWFRWQRGVRVRETERMASSARDAVSDRIERNSREIGWIAEAMHMNPCTVSDIEKIVGTIAPFELAQEWDNVGLLVGRRERTVSRVLVALDLTQDVIAEAVRLGAQAIVTHHPIMFSARKRVTDDDREGRLMLRLAEEGIAHIAAHTNLDAAPGGVNDTLMACLGAQNIVGEGFIRVGELPAGMTLEQLVVQAEQKLHARVRVYGEMSRQVSRLGCCSGSGSGEIGEAVAMGADVFITGEVKHNYALDAMDMGCAVIEAGHYETENPVCEVMANALQNAADELKYNVTVFCSKGNPFGHGV